MPAAALVNKPAEEAEAHFQKLGEAGIFLSMAAWPSAFCSHLQPLDASA
jgi:hypothetical protein